MSNNNERLAYIDFLRGIAVLGLLLMNAPFMGLAEFGYVANTPIANSDYLIATINTLLFDGRFRSLFCLLFGIGLYLQFTSYSRKGYLPKEILSSRLKWLFIFGLVHCTFIWSGDILILYALGGLFLLKRIDWPAEKQLKTGIIFFIIGIAISFIEAGLLVYFDENVTRDSKTFIDAYTGLEGPYYERVFLNLFMAVLYIVTFPIISLFYICGIMLIGIGLFRNGTLTRGFNTKALVVLCLITLLFSIIGLLILMYDFKLWQTVSSFLASVSGLSMALLLWHIVLKTKVYIHDLWVVSAIRSVGTMALSFYILQSIIFVWLFTYAQPELILTSSLYVYSSLAFAFMVIQMSLASIYKKRFSQGPLEYLWRHLVSSKLQYFHKAENSS